MGKGSGSGRGSGGYYLRGGSAPGSGAGTVAGIRHIDPHARKDGDNHHRRRTRSSSSRRSMYARPKGLLNVGNTCYANAALQCLLSTALPHALIDPKASAIFRRYSSNPNLLEQGSGSVDSYEQNNSSSQHNGVIYSFGSRDNDDDLDAAEQQEGEQGMDEQQRTVHRTQKRERRRKDRDDRRMKENCTWLTRELRSITLEYQHPETHGAASARSSAASNASATSIVSGWLSPVPAAAAVVVNPGSITKHPNRLSRCLNPYQQEDAHEFLRALLSTLVMNGQNKQLSSLFDGLLESAVTCLHCRRPSLTRDRYMDLSLDICAPHVETLTDALEEFTKTETLTGDNKVFCQKCATKRPATKGLRLATAPSILVCHLKRFAFDPYGRLVRLAKKVRFPLTLEIGDYMSRVNKARPPPYELVAVLVHQGQTCDSGHYLAYVKNAGQWYKCNDSSIEPVDVETVLKQQAYILLYEVEEMRSKNGYSPPGSSHHASSFGCHLQNSRSSSSGTHRSSSDGDWGPYLNGWREYLFSTSLCGMDDSLLREFCWDVNNDNKKASTGGVGSRSRRRDGSVSGTSSGTDGGGRNSTSTGTSRRRRRGRDVSNRSIESSYSAHQDAHDDLSTLGESTVESSETVGQIPFRRIASSGNLNRYPHHHQQYNYQNHHAGAPHSHSTGRGPRHFFADSTSHPDALPDYYRGAKPPWQAAPAVTVNSSNSSSSLPSNNNLNRNPAAAGTADNPQGTSSTSNGGGRAASKTRKERDRLPPRPEGTATTPAAAERQPQLTNVPPLPHLQQHRRASSAGNVLNSTYTSSTPRTTGASSDAGVSNRLYHI